MAGEAPGAPAGGEQARATPIATIITIMANLVGAGLLSLPYTFRRSGLLVGALAMLVMAVLNTLSMVVIARCCELSGAFSYKDMAKAALGPVGGTVVTAVMAVYTLGSCVSFSVLLGDFLPALVCEDGCNTPAQQLFGQREVTMVMAGVLVLYPLCLPRQLNALKYTSTLSAVCIVYTAIMIAARAISSSPSGRAPAGDVHLFNGVVGLFISAPILAVSLTAHYNSARFYYELSHRSLARFTGIVTAAFVVVVALYQATAVGGYLLFGSSTKGDVLQNFADNDVPAFIARIALSAIVISCYPLAFNAFRGSVAALLPAAWQEQLQPPAARRRVSAAELAAAAEATAVDGGRKHKSSDADKAGDGRSGSDDEALNCSLLPHGEGGDDGESSAINSRRARRRCCPSPAALLAASRADWAHALLTKLLVMTTVLIAVALPQVEVVLGYKGALGGSLIVYVFPAVMLFSLTQQDKARRAAAARGGVEGAAAAGAGSGDVGGSNEEETAPLASGAAAAPKALGVGVGGGIAGGPGPLSAAVWRPADIFSTRHGLLLLGFGALGLVIMVTGTLTTAGVLTST